MLVCELVIVTLALASPAGADVGAPDCSRQWLALAPLATHWGPIDDVQDVALAEFGGSHRIVAAARFPLIAARRAAAWDSVRWVPLGADRVTAVGFGPGPGAPLVARLSTGVAFWSGSAWQQAPNSNTWLSGFTNFDDGSGAAIYGEGEYLLPGDIRRHVVMRWNGALFEQVGEHFTRNTPSDDVNLRALAVYDDGTGESLYAAGLMRDCAGIPTLGVARWDGAAWVGVAGGFPEAFGSDIVASPPTGPGGLYAVSVLTSQSREAVVKLDPLGWTTLGETSVEGSTVQLGFLDLDNGHELVAMGDFASIGGLAAPGIARWDGLQWRPLGHSFTGGMVRGVLNVADGPLAGDYVYGDFTAVNGIPAPGIVRWGCPLPDRCDPDLTTTAAPGSPGYGIPDGILNSDDFFYYLAQYAAGNLPVADLTTTALPGSPGYGVPNGILNSDDFFYYLILYGVGC